MGRLGMKERRFLAEILLGFITRNYRRVAECISRPAMCRGHHSVEDFAQAIRAIGEPIHNRTAEEISMAKLLTLLLRGHRHVRHGDAARIDPAAEDHGRGRRRRAHARSASRHVDDLRAGGFAARTERLSRQIDAMAENGLRFDAETAKAIGKAEARYNRSGRVALWVIAATLVFLAWQIV
jgi:ubiquinone biosynthesis protein